MFSVPFNPRRVAREMSAVFTYGSLMFEPVWSMVVSTPGRAPMPATINGYQRFCVRGETYPAIVAVADGQVSGMLYVDVTDEQLATLDAFEGSDYQRIEVAAGLTAPSTEQKTQPAAVPPAASVVPTDVRAWVYLFLNEPALDTRMWDPVRFESRDMAGFMRTYRPTGNRLKP